MKRWMVFGLAAILSWCAACDSTTDPLEEAWAAFESGDYVTAHQLFTEKTGSEGASAYVGLGWTAMRMNKDSIKPAIKYYQIAAVADTIVDGYAGWTFAAWADTQFQACVDLGQVTLRQDRRYIFNHDRFITYEDIQLHQAFSHFHLGQYGQCINKIRDIDTSFHPVMDSTLANQLLMKLQGMGDIE